MCKAQGIEGFDLTAQDIIDLATGSVNRVIDALNKLIKLLPIEPLDAEELRDAYEQAEKALIAA